MVRVGNLCEFLVAKLVCKDLQRHVVQLRGLNAQAQARLHRARAGGFQAAQGPWIWVAIREDCEPRKGRSL